MRAISLHESHCANLLPSPSLTCSFSVFHLWKAFHAIHTVPCPFLSSGTAPSQPRGEMPAPAARCWPCAAGRCSRSAFPGGLLLRRSQAAREPFLYLETHMLWLINMRSETGRGGGDLGLSAATLTTALSLWSAVCDTFPRLPTLPQCSCAQQHGAAWWLMRPPSDVVAPECHRIAAPLLPEAREVQLASGAVAPSVHPPYSSHESVFVTCS